MIALRTTSSADSVSPVTEGRGEAVAAVRSAVVHDAVPGRLRLRHPGLALRDDIVRVLGERMAQIRGIRTVRANPVTGSILIEYVSPLTARRVKTMVDAIVAGRPMRLPRPAPRLQSLSAAVLHPDLLPAGMPWHATPVSAVADRLAARQVDGLAPDEARRRLAAHGRNELTRAEPRSAAAILVEQLTSLPIVLLGASAALSILTGGIADAVIIGAVVLLNAGIATTTERQAERTILGLADYTPKPVPVVRDGRRCAVDPADLVPGDLVLLEPGTLVPADARLLASDALTVNESALTGEAMPAHKQAEILLPPDVGLADRRNMVFRGTAVTGGSGAALVTATGPVTEIGRIQQLLGTLHPPETPMQRQLGDVGRELVIVNGLICSAVFAIGMLRGHGLVPMLRSAISLAVAAIPEGLPAVATTTLALGIQDMRRRDVLVRRLDAVETLGAVEVIGLDKTGTLTENRMATVAVHVDGVMLALDGGVLTRADEATDEGLRGVVTRLLEAASLCSDAIVRPSTEGALVEGTPTESALVEAALQCGVDVVGLRLSARVLTSVPRAEGRKRMSTLHETGDGGRLLCVKGDPVEVLARCTRHLTAAGTVPLDDAARMEVTKANERMAGQALRVLGMAKAVGGGDPHDERDLVWLGLGGLANPIRPSVVPALKTLHGAGIRTVMITGDQSATAFAIARSLDLANGNGLRVLEAGQIAGVPSDVLAALVAQPQVFARVSPVDKLNIVKALQTDGHIVAMTGDGVNDGPALRAADVGIAMGGGGTDVAREVADIVLAGDDLDGIVEAIRLGRATYANIRKVLRYLVSTNASETFTMLGAAIAGASEPLTPMQLLWLNLASDVLPALALGLEEPDDDVLSQPPHDPRAPILTPLDFRHILREGAVMGTAALAGYYLAGGAAGAARAGTVTFHGITVAQLLHAIACRSETRGAVAELGRRPSPRVYGALVASGTLQVVAQLFPFTRRLLGLSPIGFADIAAIGGIAVGSLVANDVISYVMRDTASPSRPPLI